MTRTEGTVGDRGADGWVSWTTVDDGNSYLPTIHCGSFELVLARGSHWTGDADESKGTVLVAMYGEDAFDDCDEPADNVAELKFVWCQDYFLRAVADALEQLEERELAEHPAPHNVLEAARELWIALMLEGREAF